MGFFRKKNNAPKKPAGVAASQPMQKKLVRTKPNKLRPLIIEGIAKSGTDPTDKLFRDFCVRGATIRHLLGKFKLPPNLNRKVSSLVSNSIRLDWMSHRYSSESVVARDMTMVAIKCALEEIPGYLERNSQKLPAEEISKIEASRVSLPLALRTIEGMNPTRGVEVSNFIGLAIKVNDDALNYYLGRRRLKILRNGLRKTLAASRKMEATD